MRLEIKQDYYWSIPYINEVIVKFKEKFKLSAFHREMHVW